MDLPEELLSCILSMSFSLDLRLVCREWMSLVHNEFILSAYDVTEHERKCADSVGASLLEVLKSRSRRVGVDITEDQLQQLSTIPRIVRSLDKYRSRGPMGRIGPAGCSNFNGMYCAVYPKFGPDGGEAHVPYERSPTFDDLY